MKKNPPMIERKRHAFLEPVWMGEGNPYDRGRISVAKIEVGEVFLS